MERASAFGVTMLFRIIDVLNENDIKETVCYF